MLKKLGWKEGEGLGKEGAGIAEPVSFVPFCGIVSIIPIYML